MKLKKTPSVTAVVRSFQSGKSFDTFNAEKCDAGVVAPIRKLLDTAPDQLKHIVVVTCGEKGSKFSEEIKDETTPTLAHLQNAFSAEVKRGKIILHICKNWGLNPGSGNALNEGLAIATNRGSNHVLNWSPEIDLSGHMLTLMLYHMYQHALELVGYMRNRWYLRLQWSFAQNTCALWRTDTLNGIGGFDPVCNGDGVTTIATPEFGGVPLAGMEDIHAYFKACKVRDEFIRWGNVGVSNPVSWNLALKEPGTEEYQRNAQKIARQGLVMEEYARMIFPEHTPAEVFEAMMAACHND